MLIKGPCGYEPHTLPLRYSENNCIFAKKSLMVRIKIELMSEKGNEFIIFYQEGSNQGEGKAWVRVPNLNLGSSQG